MKAQGDKSDNYGGLGTVVHSAALVILLLQLILCTLYMGIVLLEQNIFLSPIAVVS